MVEGQELNRDTQEARNIDFGIYNIYIDMNKAKGM